MSDGNRNRAEQHHVYDYTDWEARLDGVESALPAKHVGLGFYARREKDGSIVGIAVWLGEDGRPVVKVGHRASEPLVTAEAEEDWSHEVFAWAWAVEEDQYRLWMKTGAWPDGTRLERPQSAQAKAERQRRLRKPRTHLEPRVTDRAALLAHYREDTRFWSHPSINIALGSLAGADVRTGKTVPGFALVPVESSLETAS